MIYAYMRISTNKQDCANQRFEIERFCESASMTIDRWITETISSRKDLEKRKLGKLLSKLRQGDILITSELSRLGRNLLQVMSILNHCMNVDCQVWAIKENYKLGGDISSKVLAFAFSLSAEIEKNLISARTKQTLQRLKAEGKKLGRPTGSRNVKLKLAGKENRIQRMINHGWTKAKIARNLNVNVATIYRFMKNHLFQQSMN